jgi:predicted GTPase
LWLVGRPNVSKSTFFGHPLAIVEQAGHDPRPPVRRAEWNGRVFTWWTGRAGLRTQVMWGPKSASRRIAIAGADVIVFMLDATTG